MSRNGIICTNSEDDGRRLFDVLANTGKFNPAFLFFIPMNDLKADVKYFTLWVEKLKAAMEASSGKKITPAALKSAIALCNETRSLLRQVYEQRKQAKPALSGTEMMRLCLAAKVMPREEFNKEVKALLPYLKQREAKVKSAKPRLLISADHLDDWRYADLIENQVGAVIAMDDLDYGSRFCCEDVSTTGNNLTGALAEHYLALPDYCGMGLWWRSVDRVIKWVREFEIAGVVQLVPSGLFPREMRTPYFKTRLEAEHIPFSHLKIEYQFANPGQLTTRIGAFVEMLG